MVVTNPFLLGNYGPVATECTEEHLAVTGAVPPELAGRYLRTGPNPYGAADPEKYHWFIGDGMVHGVELRDGRARWYRNRWVRTDPIAAALGESPRGGPAQPMYDSSNTNVIGHAGIDLLLDRRCDPLPPHARARHDRSPRLRRAAAHGFHRAPEDRPGHGRAPRLRLLVGRAVPAVSRDRREREPRAHGADHGRRPDDDARLRAHAVVGGVPRPARRVRHEDGGARRVDAVSLGRRLRRARRRHAARRRRRRRALVRRRSLLRVPSDERVRRRRHGRDRRRAASDDVPQQRDRPERRRCPDARPLDDRSAGGQGARGPPRRPWAGVPARQRVAA